MNFAQRLSRLAQAMLAPGAAAHFSARLRQLAGAIGNPALDLGCGFISRPAGAGIAAIGLDIDERRVRVRIAPAVVGDAACLPFGDSRFAAAFSFGLLHHLSDADARRSISEMGRVVRQSGLIVIFDGVPPERARRRPLAAAIRALDRGHYMRTEPQLRSLFDGAPGWHYERVTYAATGLEGLWCMRGAGG